MKDTMFGLRSTALAAALVIAGAAHAEPSVYPTGVTIDQPGKTFDTFTVFSAPDGRTHVIDMAGHDIHQWPHPGLPGAIIDPKLTGGAKGHVLLQTAAISGMAPGMANNQSAAEFDWDGHAMRQWGTAGTPLRQNHDWARLHNGDTLLLVAVPHRIAALANHFVYDQAIEDRAPDGHVVWRWTAGDHLAEFGFSTSGMAALTDATATGTPDPWGYLEINDMQPLGPNRWFDAGDTRFAPDNIMIDTRKGNVVLIIDRRTGHVVWRMGPEFGEPARDADRRITHDMLPRPVDQLSGQHDAHLIPQGLPGAGDLLLFDDQGPAGFPRVPLGVYGGSRVLEINPTTRQIVWDYTALKSGLPPWTFFSSFVSSAQRLPNGNTLIDEGMNGRIFQIAPSGEIVWEYMSPYRGPMAFGGARVTAALVYRAQAVPASWLPGSPKPRP